MYKKLPNVADVSRWHGAVTHCNILEKILRSRKGDQKLRLCLVIFVFIITTLICETRQSLISETVIDVCRVDAVLYYVGLILARPSRTFTGSKNPQHFT